MKRQRIRRELSCPFYKIKYGAEAYFNKCQIHTILKSSSEGLNNKHFGFHQISFVPSITS